MPDTTLVIFFFVIALVYAAAGFGGGSSYIAILILWGVSETVLRPAALVCNIVVVSSNIFLFYKNDLLDLRKVAPLSMLSVPCAFLGGLWGLKWAFLSLILGFSLVFAGFLLFFQDKILVKNGSLNPLKLYVLSGGIGFLSGLVGIGGGIFLSPILHIIRFDTPKKIAATSSFFILINSLSGLLGIFLQKNTFDWAFVIPLSIAVFLGGQLGLRWAIFQMPQKGIRFITAFLVLYAGMRLLGMGDG